MQPVLAWPLDYLPQFFLHACGIDLGQFTWDVPPWLSFLEVGGARKRSLFVPGGHRRLGLALRVVWRPLPWREAPREVD